MLVCITKYPINFIITAFLKQRERTSSVRPTLDLFLKATHGKLPRDVRREWSAYGLFRARWHHVIIELNCPLSCAYWYRPHTHVPHELHCQYMIEATDDAIVYQTYFGTVSKDSVWETHERRQPRVDGIYIMFFFSFPPLSLFRSVRIPYNLLYRTEPSVLCLSVSWDVIKFWSSCDWASYSLFIMRICGQFSGVWGLAEGSLPAGCRPVSGEQGALGYHNVFNHPANKAAAWLGLPRRD